MHIRESLLGVGVYVLSFAESVDGGINLIVIASRNTRVNRGKCYSGIKKATLV